MSSLLELMFKCTSFWWHSTPGVRSQGLWKVSAVQWPASLRVLSSRLTPSLAESLNGSISAEIWFVHKYGGEPAIHMLFYLFFFFFFFSLLFYFYSIFFIYDAEKHISRYLITWWKLLKMEFRKHFVIVSSFSQNRFCFILTNRNIWVFVGYIENYYRKQQKKKKNQP